MVRFQNLLSRRFKNKNKNKIKNRNTKKQQQQHCIYYPPFRKYQGIRKHIWSRSDKKKETLKTTTLKCYLIRQDDAVYKSKLQKQIRKFLVLTEPEALALNYIMNISTIISTQKICPPVLFENLLKPNSAVLSFRSNDFRSPLWRGGETRAASSIGNSSLERYFIKT